MKTNYKNLISWISESKSLRDNDNVEIGITSIKLNNDQLKTLNSLIERKSELESGFVIGNAIRAKIYLTEGERSYAPEDNYIGVEIGSENEGDQPWTAASLRDLSFDPNFEIIDNSNPLAILVKNGLERIMGSPENLYHVQDFFRPFIESNKKEILKYLNSMKDLVREFDKFFMEIKLPCWIDWYVYKNDENDDLCVPWDYPEYDAEGCHIWCNFKYNLLTEALNLLAKGEEVFFETVKVKN
jgi:hypothetical protein